MRGETKERWQNLCEQAAIEQDPERLMDLIDELCAMLEDKEKRLRQREAEGQARDRFPGTWRSTRQGTGRSLG
jgi:hypothetical protein